MCVCTRNTSQMNGTWCEGITYCNICVDKKCKHIAQYGSNEWAVLGAQKVYEYIGSVRF